MQKWVRTRLADAGHGSHRNASNSDGANMGGSAVQLTQSGHDSSPVVVAGRKTLAFLSSRGGESQVYLLSMEGGESHRADELSTRRGYGEVVAGRKDDCVYVLRYPDCKDDACNNSRDEEKEKSKVKRMLRSIFSIATGRIE